MKGELMKELFKDTYFFKAGSLVGLMKKRSKRAYLLRRDIKGSSRRPYFCQDTLLHQGLQKPLGIHS
jgi:hypothetical protein